MDNLTRKCKLTAARVKKHRVLVKASKLRAEQAVNPIESSSELYGKNNLLICQLNINFFHYN